MAFGWRLCATTVWGPRSPKRTFVDIQWAIGQLVDELPEKGGSAAGWLIPVGLRGQPLWSARIRKPANGWLLGCLPW
jgi:hypothetical protein